jgi:thioester reductase-like protein
MGTIGSGVFLTGATGFLGSEILKRFLASHPQSRVIVLVRSTPHQTARDRVESLLLGMFGVEGARAHRDRIEIVNGDISLPDFGLDGARLMDLRARVDQVIHSAAIVRLELTRNLASTT